MRSVGTKPSTAAPALVRPSVASGTATLETAHRHMYRRKLRFGPAEGFWRYTRTPTASISADTMKNTPKWRVTTVQVNVRGARVTA
jgi:hypothetical protein